MAKLKLAHVHRAQNTHNIISWMSVFNLYLICEFNYHLLLGRACMSAESHIGHDNIWLMRRE